MSRRTRIRLPILRFAVLAALTSLSSSFPRQVQPSSNSHEEPDLTFKVTRIGDGPIKLGQHRGPWYKVFSLMASNSHELYLVSIPFESDRDARKEYRKSLKNAEEIIRKEAELDEKGKKIGERAVMRCPATKGALQPPDSATHYSVILISGHSFLNFTGEHLDEVLALEARVREKGTSVLWTGPF